MKDVSPPKWHLAHTTWFFEEFVLAQTLHGADLPRYEPFHNSYRYLFNSYYEGVGARHPRELRGLLSRPSYREILRYRKEVDHSVESFVLHAMERGAREILEAFELGIQHEEQHQELLLTDIKYILWSNPLKPAYRKSSPLLDLPKKVRPPFLEFEGGCKTIGSTGMSFSFDHEKPSHEVRLYPFELGRSLITHQEYLEFMNAGGYQDPKFWLSDGFQAVRENDWSAPLYWEREKKDAPWFEFTLAGLKPLDLEAPVTHISFYEADAFARWRGARLPLEAEWEAGALTLEQAFDVAWQWTGSPFVAYPGFRPLKGTFGEYNGKFMCNQLVLRGGSSATPKGHSRPSYRNFFPPTARWQFTGLRLARDRDLGSD
jgi:ergothioneine biosynthesis protein EgtB